MSIKDFFNKIKIRWDVFMGNCQHKNTTKGLTVKTRWCCDCGKYIQVQK